MKHSIVALPLVALVVAACASSQPSSQLQDARRVYGNVSASEANVYAPAEVMTAKQALERAERAHEEDANSFHEKRLAYIAQRQAEIAALHADIKKAQRDEENAQARYSEKLQELRSRVENQLDDTRGDVASMKRELATQSARFQQERQARLEADRRASAALQSLREVAQVKEESRGTVITLDGAVLFATGKSELLPIARQKLDRVATALRDVDSRKAIVIEGHTDARGTDQMNLELSQARADSVRDYLVSRGVSAEQVRAVGRGEEQPLASNDNPEGRANNRRVEIVVQSAQAADSKPGSTPTSTGQTSSAPSSASQPAR